MIEARRTKSEDLRAKCEGCSATIDERRGESGERREKGYGKWETRGVRRDTRDDNIEKPDTTLG